MKKEQSSRYSSIPKRSFFYAIVRLLETEYKIIGSKKVITMIAEDIERLHKEYYPDMERRSLGEIVWQTTASTEKKPHYGKKAEDYEVKTVILPLITKEDIEEKIKGSYTGRGITNQKQMERDIRVMARLVKGAYEQGGLLSGAEISCLLNRSLTVIGRYMRVYHERHSDILPTKGMILDQGSKPTHKASIVNLYEQGYPEVDIARLTNHSIDAVSRYIKNYKNIRLLLEKSFNLMEMVRISGMGRSTVLQYRELVELYHPEIKSLRADKENQNDEDKEDDNKEENGGRSESKKKIKVKKHLKGSAVTAAAATGAAPMVTPVGVNPSLRNHRH